MAKPDDRTPRVLNVNVPNVSIGEVKGVCEAELAAHGEVWIASADVSDGDLKLEFTGRGEAAPGTDVAVIRDGYVAVTPLVSVARATPRDVRGAAEAIEAERAWARILPEQSGKRKRRSDQRSVPSLDSEVSTANTRRNAMT